MAGALLPILAGFRFLGAAGTGFGQLGHLLKQDMPGHVHEMLQRDIQLFGQPDRGLG
jgi:hypothetical protein